MTKITFIFDRETKGTFRLQEIDPTTRTEPLNPVVGTLYLRKAAAEKLGLRGAPKLVELELKVVE